ncbi:MAG: polyphosphate kinase 2 family protein [Treponemataceae bacterium]|nr:polyphosphate kinase 2 family protein [Treponemataceae bacterium]
MMKIDEYKFDGSNRFDIFHTATDSGGREKLKKEIVEQTHKNLAELLDLQAKLYAEAREAVLIVLQALDAAGKDSTIKHVMSGVNPLGIEVCGFRTPTIEEASHDFLWRYHKNVPARGSMCIFNRSYYEEVLVVKVHEDYKNYRVPARMLRGNYIKQKYKDICNWESYLYGNGTKIIKIFLNLSKDEQKKRFLERIERPEKNWKFSANDLKERPYFEQYQKAFEDAVNNTATKKCPWYVLPADQKWYTRYLVSEILVRSLKEINPGFPKISAEQKKNLAECKEALLAESPHSEE